MWLGRQKHNQQLESDAKMISVTILASISITNSMPSSLLPEIEWGRDEVNPTIGTSADGTTRLIVNIRHACVSEYWKKRRDSLLTLSVDKQSFHTKPSLPFVPFRWEKFVTRKIEIKTKKYKIKRREGSFKRGRMAKTKGPGRPAPFPSHTHQSNLTKANGNYQDHRLPPTARFMMQHLRLE